jgi:hypothetical protein
VSRFIHGFALAGILLLGTASAVAAPPRVYVRQLAKTGLPLGDIASTGGHLFYIAENTGQIDESGLAGRPLRPLVTLPRAGEEVRCVPAPTGHGFAAGLYCHTARNNIYRVTTAGRVVLFARLPERRTSDGALAFDTTGRFGFALLAATGRSDDHHGGAVFAISPRAAVTTIASYPGPGGAENAAIAPAGFGAVAGDLLLTTDTARIEGRLLAIDPRDHVSIIATVHGDGLNSLAVIPHTRWEGPTAGIAIADTRSRTAWLVPAAAIQPYAGDVMVANELRGWIFTVEPVNGGYRTLRLDTSLTGPQYNLEGAGVIP